MSTDQGDTWSMAQLPSVGQEQFYSILAANDDMVFMHVDEPGGKTHLVVHPWMRRFELWPLLWAFLFTCRPFLLPQEVYYYPLKGHLFWCPRWSVGVAECFPEQTAQSAELKLWPGKYRKDSEASVVCLMFSWDRDSLYNPRWLQTHDAPALTSWMLGLQVCTTLPSLETHSHWIKQLYVFWT